MRRDLFTPQQFPLSCCLKGSEMSLEKKGQTQVTLERKHTRFCVIANKARQCCCVQLELQEMDFWVCLCSPQQGTNVILLAVSSSQVFLLPSSDLTSLLNSATTCAVQLVQLFWPREPWGLREIELQRGGGGGEVNAKVTGLWRGKCMCLTCVCTVMLLYNFVSIKHTWKSGCPRGCCGHPVLCVIESALIVAQPFLYDEWLWAAGTDETNSSPCSNYGPLSDGASIASCLQPLSAQTTISTLLFWWCSTQSYLVVHLFICFQRA